MRALRSVSNGHGAVTASVADALLGGAWRDCDDLIGSIISGETAAERAHSLCALLGYIGVLPGRS